MPFQGNPSDWHDFQICQSSITIINHNHNQKIVPFPLFSYFCFMQLMTIIAPVDFSECAYRAALYAVNLATDAHARVILLNFVERPVMPVFAPLEAAQGVQAEVKRERRAQLEAFQKKLLTGQEGKLPLISTTLVHGASLAEALRDFTNQNPVDMVVMGSKGAGAITRILMGSNTVDVLKSGDIRVPIWVVPEHAEYRPFRKVTIALDPERPPKFDVLMESLDRLAPLKSSILEVLGVTSSARLESAFDNLPNLDSLRRHFAEVHLAAAERKGGQGIASTLIDAARNSDLLILAPYRRGFWAELLGQSVTADLAYYAELPLLIMPRQES
jgi:nucleotide-binding universal stress UspA family protein